MKQNKIVISTLRYTSIIPIIMTMVVFVMQLAGCSHRFKGWAIAANSGDIQLTKDLIFKSKDLGLTDMYSDTPLHWAARNGQADVVDSLIIISKTLDINEKNQVTGETALICAVKENHKNIVKILINNGADKGAQDNTGFSALNWASRRGNKEIIEVLMKDPSSDVSLTGNSNSLVLAVYSGDLATVKLFVKEGLPINASDSYGETPLIAAVKIGNIDILEYLIKQGADTQSTDRLGRIPIMLAAQAGYIDIISFLIETGTDINEQTKQGYTPLVFASANGQGTTVDYLLQNGADPNIRNNEGLSAIYLAAVQGHWLIEVLLLDGGTDLFKENLKIAEDNPYAIAPMYELAADYYLEKNNKEKAIYCFNIAEKAFINMSNIYKSRARGEAVREVLSFVGKALLVTALAVAEQEHAKTQARQRAQYSALAKSKTLSEYHQRLATSSPSYETAALIASQERQHKYDEWVYSNTSNTNITKKRLYELSDKAVKKAEKIKAMLSCIEESNDEDFKKCGSLQ